MKDQIEKMRKKIKRFFCNHEYVLGDLIFPPSGGYMPNGDCFKCICEKCGKEVITYLTYEQQVYAKKGCRMS